MPWLRICGPTVVVMAGEEGAQLRSENRCELSVLLCHCCVPRKLLWTRVSRPSVCVGDLSYDCLLPFPLRKH